MSERLPTPRLLGMMGGLWIWAAQFTLVYGLTALACARGHAEESVAGVNLVRLAIAAVTLIALALDGAVLVPALQARRELSAQGPATSGDAMINHATITIAAVSLVAIAYTGLPALIVPVCT